MSSHSTRPTNTPPGSSSSLRPGIRARSLYWRIGLGFILFLAVTLILQVALFIWVAGATEGGMPERMGRDFAELVASEFEAALAREPGLDVRSYAEQRVNELHRPAAIVFPDGSAVAAPGLQVPRNLRFPGPFRRRMGGDTRRGPPPRPLEPGPRDANPSLRPPDGAAMRPRTPFGNPRRGPVMAPIEHNDEVVAVVWVPPLTGLQRVASEIGIPLAIGAVLLLVGGTVVATLVIFRPAQARLSAVEDAARRFGDGDLSARAPEMGGDEVAAVATAFNRMAADLAARQAQLVEADRARRQLLADVSHELMTPLTAIRGYAETLGLPQFVPASREGQRAVKVIHEEGERIERLVKDLLDLARFEAGGISLVLENVAVDEIFERVSDRHAQAAQDKGVAIVIEPHEDDIRLAGDPHRLEQALQNLASNALRHTPPGGAIRLGASRDNGKVKLTVADNGAGIPAQHLPHVFDRFYKADQSRSQSGRRIPGGGGAGSGLGLSIVKAIVDRHGGSVSVRSDQGLGTVFTILLPAQDRREHPL